MTKPFEKKEILYKSLLSFLCGLLCFGSAKFPIVVDTAYDAYIHWGLLLPILISLAFGTVYAVICCLPGLAMFSPFLINPTHGWSNLVPAMLILLWAVGHGILTDLRYKKHFPFVVSYLFQILYIVLYMLIYKPCTRLLLPWNAAWPAGYAFRFLPDNILHVNELLTLEYMSLVLLFVNGLFALSSVRHLFRRDTFVQDSKMNIGIFLGTALVAVAFIFIPSPSVSTSGMSFLSINAFQISISTMEITLLKLIIVFFTGDILLHIIQYRNKLHYLEIQRKEDYTKRIQSLNEELEYKVEKRTEALQTAYQEMESFGYTVAHELKSPIRGIQIYNQIVKEDNWDVLNPDGREAVTEIDVYCKQTLELIQGILAFSKINSEKIECHQVNMTQLVKEVWAKVIVDDPYDLSKFKLELEPLQPVSGDVLLLRQAVFNILSNAVKFSSERPLGIVKVWSEDSERDIRYYFQDNGVGFDMKYAENIFSLFNRLHTEEEFEGHGVGLPIVQNIVHKHDGSVEIYAQPDQGCTVMICLPKSAGE